MKQTGLLILAMTACVLSACGNSKSRSGAGTEQPFESSSQEYIPFGLWRTQYQKMLKDLKPNY